MQSRDGRDGLGSYGDDFLFLGAMCGADGHPRLRSYERVGLSDRQSRIWLVVVSES